MVSNLYQQAEELERAGRLVEAEERWRDIVRVEPSGESLARLGRLYLWRGAVEDGERLLREAIARFPDDSSPHFHLGVYLTHEGELEEAKELLQKSVDLDEWAPALVCLGKVHRRLQETESARRCLERALVLEPENAEAYFLLGLTHQDDARHAAELFEKAVALDPEYAD